MEHQNLAARIIALKEADLRLRAQLVKSGQLFDGYHQAMEQVHNRNAKALDDIMDAIGYPTIEKVGQEGSEAAWLIIQHAIGQPHFMKKAALLLQTAVSEQQANPQNLAYLTDRIAAFEGKPQLYGTAFDWDEKGEMSPLPYDELSKVNQRRMSVGLNTLEEQTLIMRSQARKENQLPPADLTKRKREYDQWRRKVGWDDSSA